MGNIRNARTTFPRKAARRARAAERFTIKADHAYKDNAYRVRKLVEAAALGIAVPRHI